jgi:F-type H+-transporting ATPase subunit c
MQRQWAAGKRTSNQGKEEQDMLMDVLMPVLAAAEQVKEAAAPQGVAGSLTLGLAGAGAAIGVGLVGAKAAEAVGRNPTAFGNILTIGIIGMALAEAIAIYALILAFQGR